jgi:hypothetical protein
MASSITGKRAETYVWPTAPPPTLRATAVSSPR